MTDHKAPSAPLLEEEEVAAIVTELLDMLAMNAGVDPGQEPPATGGDPLTASIGITIQDTGEMPARLIIDTDTAACGTLASFWGLVGPDGATKQDAIDALGELANLVGGTVKTALDDESFVGIPEVSDGPSREQISQPTQVDHAIGRFVIQFGHI